MVTYYPPHQLRKMADDYDLGAADYGFDIRISEALRQAADDCERLDALDKLCESYGFEDLHEGNRWCIEGPFCDIRHALDAEITTRTPKEQTK